MKPPVASGVLEGCLQLAAEMEARAIAQDNPLCKSREAFENMVTRLNSNEVRNLDHAQVERLVEREGREVLRQLVQDHLDVRGDGSAGEAVYEAELCERSSDS